MVCSMVCTSEKRQTNSTKNGKNETENKTKKMNRIEDYVATLRIPLPGALDTPRFISEENLADLPV